MYNTQFHNNPANQRKERFLEPSMTEPDNAMSVAEIIARYMRGHGLGVQVLPDSADMAAREDGLDSVDDADMFSEERQAVLEAAAAVQQQAVAKEPETAPEPPSEI